MKSRQRCFCIFLSVAFALLFLIASISSLQAATKTYRSKSKRIKASKKVSIKKKKRKKEKKLLYYKNKFKKQNKRYYKEGGNSIPPTLESMRDFPTPGGAKEVDAVICNNKLVLVYTKDHNNTSDVYINTIDAQGNLGREVKVSAKDPDVGNNWMINQTMERLNPEYDLPRGLIREDEGAHLHPRIAHNPDSDFVCVVWQYSHSKETYDYRYSLILAEWFMVTEEGVRDHQAEPTVVSSINDSDGLWDSLNNKYAIDPEITSVTGFEHHVYALTYTLGYQLPYGSENRFFYSVVVKLIHITKADGLCIETWEERELVYKSQPIMTLSSANVSSNIISKDISYMEIVWEYEEAIKWKRVFLAYYVNESKVEDFHGDNLQLVSLEVKLRQRKYHFFNFWQEALGNIPFANPGLSLLIRGGHQYNDIFLAWRNDPHTLKCLKIPIVHGGMGIERWILPHPMYVQRFEAFVGNPDLNLFRDGEFDGKLLLMYTEQETLFRQDQWGDHYIYLNHLKGVVLRDSIGDPSLRERGLYHFYINPEISCWNSRAVVAQGDGWPQTICWVRELRPNYTGPRRERWIHPLSVIDVHGIELRHGDWENRLDEHHHYRTNWFRRASLDLDVQAALDAAEFQWRWDYWDERNGHVPNFDDFRELSPPVFNLYLVRNEAQAMNLASQPGVEREWIDSLSQSGWRNNIPVTSHCWAYLMADFPRYGISIKSNTERFILDPGPDNGAERELVEVNIAREGQARASSEAEGEEDENQYSAANAIDGVKFQGDIGEWAADEEPAPWLEVSFPATDIYQVILYDRVSEEENIISGTLQFSDGSAIEVGAGTPHPIAATGVALIINFVNKPDITSVRLQVHESEGLHPGLAEIEIYGLTER